MPIQTVQIEFDATMKAVLRNDEMSLSLTISMPYGDGRKVSVSVDMFSDETTDLVRQALQAAVAEGQEQGLKLAQAATAEAIAIAARGGEL